MPRRAVLLAIGMGVLCATASMPATAADAAKRRNLPVAELQNIIEQDFVEVRSEKLERGASILQRFNRRGRRCIECGEAHSHAAL